MKKACFIALICSFTALTIFAALPPEAQKEKDRLTLAFETAKKYPHEIRMQVNVQKDFLYDITIAENVGEINGEKIIPIPADIIPLWPLLRQINIYGENTGVLHAEQITPVIQHDEMERWWTGESMICLHAHNLKIDPNTNEGYSLVLKGNGAKVSHITVGDNKGISPVFDDSPYTTLGSDKPIRPIDVTIDANTLRSIEGVCELDRSKYFRLYTEPCRDLPPIEKVYREYGFLPGRQIVKFAPWLEGGYVTGQPKLTEDPNKPGYADPAYFTNHNPDLFRSEIERGFDVYKDINTKWPDLKFAMCFDNWPSFMELKSPGVRNSKGTPADFEAAAELTAQFLNAQKKYSGTTPDWIEVKNESDIADEWMYHDIKDCDSWLKLAEFHNAVADRLHQDFPAIKVGGPTSVWLMYDVDNFRVAKDQLRFMDLTKGHLDFYAHHFYEGKALISKKEYKMGAGSYLHGRGDAVLDLTANHMLLNDNVRPIVVSEYGAIHGGDKDMDYWIRLKSYSALQLIFMNRPHQFELCVPFLLPYLWWDPTDENGLFIKPEGENFQPTKMMSYLRLWHDFDGQRITCISPDSDLVTLALLDKDTIRLVANNRSDQRANLNLQLGDLHPQSIEQRRLYFDSGKLVEETNLHGTNTTAIPLAVDETSMIVIKLGSAPAPAKTVTEKYYFGDQVMQPTGKALTFNITCPTNKLSSSTLRIGIGRGDGFIGKMKVACGDFSAEVGLSHSKGMQRFYDLVKVPLPTEIIQSTNKVEIIVDELGGTITSAALLNQYVK